MQAMTGWGLIQHGGGQSDFHGSRLRLSSCWVRQPCDMRILIVRQHSSIPGGQLTKVNCGKNVSLTFVTGRGWLLGPNRCFENDFIMALSGIKNHQDD
jgi:hypothetical protein